MAEAPICPLGRAEGLPDGAGGLSVPLRGGVGGGDGAGGTAAFDPAPPPPLTPLHKGERNPRRDDWAASTRHRHALVRVDPRAWAEVLAGRPDLAGLPHLSAWARAGRPLILRRYAPGEDRALVPLGLPLPPADGKRRIGFALPSAALAPCPAPRLRDVREVAPEGWRPGLDALDALGRRHGILPRPFGALLWQAVTGLPYLTATSDLDLLWPLAGPPPAGFLDELAALAAGSALRLDGELILPGGGGVHWREAAAGATVLVKHLDRLEMRAAAELFGAAR